MKKAIIFTLCAVAALSVSAQRHVSTLSQWQFSRDGVNFTPVTVPHDWAIGGQFDKKHDLQVVAIKENGEETATEHTGRSGALPWIGRGEYTTTFSIPAGHKFAALVFDGAMSEPVVYVNGKEAGRWAYGYNAFRVDVTPFLNPNGAPNTVRVVLNNLEESSRWYPGGGIYRPVTLISTPSKRHIDEWGTFVRTLKADKQEAQVLVSTECISVSGSVRLTVKSPAGAVVAQETVPCSELGLAEAQFKISSPALWSPESPNLYTLETQLLTTDGEVLDNTCTRFGIRTISFSREHGFQLNGVTRKFRGVCLHHDLGPIGAAVNKAALIRQIKILKDMGADAIRTSHNMPSTMQMELCDSLGMLVMAESFDGWKDPKVKNGYGRFWDEWWQRDITNLIRNHRNHPSIVMWSVGNEIPEQWKTEGAERYRRLVGLCHLLDPSRPVTCGMDNPDADIASGFAFAADVPGYNYRTHRYEPTFGQLPQGFLLGSETASTVSSRGVYMFPDTVAIGKAYENGQCSGYDLEHCWWSNLPEDDWRLQDDFNWTVGEFVWTGFDYLGEPTPYDAYWPSRSSYYGISDLAGLPKDRFFLYRSHWNKNAHTIHLLPHWTWPDRKGKVTPVYCYTDYPEAELFVNGKSQGRISKNRDSRLDRYRLRWRNVVYEPGELKVVVYDKNGNAAGEQTLRTAGKAAKLRLTADRAELTRATEDLAFVTGEMTDKNGNLCPHADDQLTFTVSGAGKFRAVCNGDATSLEPFTKPTMKLFGGKLVVVVEAGQDAGDITLTVTAPKKKIKQTITLSVK